MDTLKQCKTPHISNSKGVEKQHHAVEIGFDVDNSSQFIPGKPYSICCRVLTVMMILSITSCALGGVAFEVINWRSISQMSDVSKKPQFSSKIDVELDVYQ